MANKFPLVFDTTGKSLQELPTGDNLNLAGSSILDVIDVTATGTLTVNTVSAQNINVAGSALAEVAKTNDYNDLSNKPTLFSGDYNDLTNKPTSISSDWADITNKPVIASKLSQLVNDTNFVSNAQINIIPSQVTGLATIASTGSFNDLTNVPDYITREEAAGGTLTVELKNTGDLIGSVFGTDSSVIVDHLTSTINASTVNTDILTANLMNTADFNLNATDNVNITTSQYLNLRSTSFRLVNTLSGTEIYDVDAITFRGDVDFRFANVTGLILDQVIGNLTGSVFADDSSLMIDGISREIFASSIDTNDINTDTLTTGPITNKNGGLPLSVTSTAGITLSPGGVLNVPNATNITLNATNTISIEASGDLSLTSSSGIVDFPSGTTVDFTGATVTGLNVPITGDLTGSVFGDDSTVLVDGVNNAIRGDSISTGGGFYKIQVDNTVARLQYINGSTTAGISVNNVTGTAVGGAGGASLYADAGGSISIGNTAGSGSITIGNGTNTVTLASNTTLDLSDLTSIDFSNTTISNFAGNGALYTAGDATNWEGTPPSTVGEAIDRLVAWITDFKNNDSTDPNRPAP